MGRIQYIIRKIIAEIIEAIPQRHCYLLLLTLILLGKSFPCSASYRIYGKVTDASTNKALPYVSVYIEYTSDGCQTDKDGNFSFMSPTNKGKLIASYIGYEDASVEITPQTQYPIHIKLHPIAYELSEIEIKPKRERYKRKENPAVELAKELIKNRECYRLEYHDYYQRNRHELLTIALNNFDKNQIQTNLLSKINLLDHFTDTSLISGKPILNISSRELIGSDHYRKDPKSKKKHIIARRRAGVDDFISEQEIDGIFEEVFKDVDVFTNDIDLFHNRFTSPLSNFANNIYKYYIMDTIMVDGERCIDLAFIPFNTESHGFTGHIYVTDDSTRFIKWIQLRSPYNINLNFVRTLNITQKFSRNANGSSQLDKEILVAEFEIASNINGVYVKREVNYNKYNFNQPENKDIFDSPTDILEEYDSREKDEIFWIANRIGHVSSNELSVSAMMNQLRQYPLYYWSEKAISFLFTGYIPNKKNNPTFYYGPVNTTISNNELEGIRLRIGGMTSAYLNPHLMGQFFVAYGFGDQRFKYMGELEYSFNKKKEHANEFPIHSLRLHYENDIFQYGQSYLYTNKDNFFLNFKRTDDNLISYLRKGEFSYNREHYSGFSYSFILRNNVYEDSRFIQFESREKGVSTFHPELQQTELELKLRYAPGEKFNQKKGGREYLLPERPIFSLSHTIAYKGVLGSDFTCHHTEGSFHKRFWLSSFGYVDAILKGGHVWNKVPYPLLIIPASNLSYTIQKESFALMNPMEFIADRYISWETTYYMNGLLFNRIPLIKRLGWREVIDFRGFYGSISTENIPDATNSNGLYMFPRKHQLLTNIPYMELSFGIENIFKLFEIDYVHRLTYINSPGIDKHGFRIRAHIQF